MGRPAAWIITAVLLKILYLAICVQFLRAGGLLDPTGSSWLWEGGDAHSYLVSVDNLIDHGVYGYDLMRPASQAGRMPGYAFVYFPLRLVLTREAALNSCALLQAALDGVSVYYLALTGLVLTGSKNVFVLTYLGYLFSTYVSSWNYRGVVESWAAAAAIFAVYNFVIALREPGRQRVIAAGVFSAWCVFLKPVFVPVVVLLAGVLTLAVVRCGGFSVRRAVAYAGLFLLPLALLDVGWVARNYPLFSKVVPLQIDENAGYGYSRSFLSLVALMKAWGVDYVAWNPKAEVRWFDTAAGLQKNEPTSYGPPTAAALPEFVYASCYARGDLLKTRATYLRAHDASVAAAERHLADQQAAETLDSYRLCFRQEKPLRYYVLSPIRLAGLFLLHSGTYNLFPGRHAVDLGPFALVFKVGQTALYLLVVLAGLPSAVVWLAEGLRRRRPAVVVVPGVFLYFALFFPLVLRRAEYRYLVAGFSFGILSLAAVVVELAGRLRLRLYAHGLAPAPSRTTDRITDRHG